MILLKTSFLSGLRKVAPLLLGIFPFALIAGAAAVKQLEFFAPAMGFSLFIFAGASQLAALDLLANQAPVWMVIFTAWVVNLRFVIYSASLAPHFKECPFFWKKAMAYLLTDQAFALTSQRVTEPGTRQQKLMFYFGAAMGLWLTWQVGSLFGVVLGNRVPASWSLEFAVPLSFIAIVVPTIKDRAAVIAALVTMFCILLTAAMPLKLGFLLSVALGVTAGNLVAGRQLA